MPAYCQEGRRVLPNGPRGARSGGRRCLTPCRWMTWSAAQGGLLPAAGRRLRHVRGAVHRRRGRGRGSACTPRSSTAGTGSRTRRGSARRRCGPANGCGGSGPAAAYWHGHARTGRRGPSSSRSARAGASPVPDRRAGCGRRNLAPIDVVGNRDVALPRAAEESAGDRRWSCRRIGLLDRAVQRGGRLSHRWSAALPTTSIGARSPPRAAARTPERAPGRASARDRELRRAPRRAGSSGCRASRLPPGRARPGAPPAGRGGGGRVGLHTSIAERSVPTGGAGTRCVRAGLRIPLRFTWHRPRRAAGGQVLDSVRGHR